MKFSFPVSAMVIILSAAAAADEHVAIPDQVELCLSCHGENGIPIEPDYPIINGQHLYYLYVQLKDFKSGSRQSVIMGPIVSNLEKSTMLTLAEYFSGKKWPNIGFRGDAAKTGKGETAAVAGQCVQCHLGSYKGNSRIPRVAGQQPQYLEQTMLDFKSKKRMNSPAKSSLLASYEESEIEALAHFMGDM